MIHAITIEAYALLPGVADDTASVAGAVLTHNGTEYDLSSIADGGDGTPSGDHPFIGTITRTGSTLTYRLKMGYSTATAVKVQTRTDWAVSLEDEAVPDLVERVTP